MRNQSNIKYYKVEKIGEFSVEELSHQKFFYDSN